MNWVVKLEDIPEFMEQYDVKCSPIRKGLDLCAILLNNTYLFTSPEPVDYYIEEGYKLYNPKNQRILKRLGKLTKSGANLSTLSLKYRKF